MMPCRAGLVALLVVGVVACGGGDDSDAAEDQDATSSTAARAGSTAAATDDQSEEDEVVERYLGFWDARFEANSPPNPDHADLAEYATGELLLHAIAEARTNDEAGVEFRRSDDPIDFREVVVVRMHGDQARVQDCRVDDGLIVRRSDGQVVDDDVTTQSLIGDLERVDGEWRVARSTLIQRWEGVAGCALAD